MQTTLILLTESRG